MKSFWNLYFFLCVCAHGILMRREMTSATAQTHKKNIAMVSLHI